MKFTLTCFLALGAVFGSAQYLLVSDSQRDKLVLLNATTGAVVNYNFLQDSTKFGTVISALQVDGELWLTDQTNNAIHRYSASLTPTFLGSITTGISSIRGASIVGNEVWVTNQGSTNGASGPSIVRFSKSGSQLSSFALPPAGTSARSPWGVVQAGNKVFVSDSTGEDILTFDTNGNYQGIFVDGVANSTLSFPQQMFAEGSNLYVAGFSIPTGVYRYGIGAGATNTGLLSSYVISGSLGPRGISRLGNGNILAAGGTRLVLIDTSGPQWSDTDIVNDFVSASNFASFRHVSAFNPVPEPTTMAVLGLGALGLLRRKRK